MHRHVCALCSVSGLKGDQIRRLGMRGMEEWGHLPCRCGTDSSAKSKHDAHLHASLPTGKDLRVYCAGIQYDVLAVARCTGEIYSGQGNEEAKAGNVEG